MPPSRGALPHAVASRFVAPKPEESRMPKLAIARPLGERDLGHEVGLHPVHVLALRTSAGERRAIALSSLEPVAEVSEGARIEAGADLAGVDEHTVVMIADEERAKPLARAGRVRETADHEFLLVHALELEPVRRAGVLVGGRRVLGDDALESTLAGVPPRGFAGTVPVGRVAQPPSEREQPLEHSLSIPQRNSSQIVTARIRNVERIE